MMSKRFSVVVCMVLILGAFLMQIPLATADVEKYEKVLGSRFDTTVFSDYWGNTVSSGFGTAMSVNAPVHPGVGGQVSKVAFAVELDEPFEAVVPIPGYGPVVCDCYPTVENMWVKVEGDSYYWPSPNQIVDNTGTGGICWPDWTILFDILIDVLPAILFMLHESPPETEWETDAHWVKAIVREKAMDDPPLQSAAANFGSLFDKKGYNTLTITAGSSISIRCFGFWNGIPVATMVDIGEYSLDFPVEVPVTNEPDTPSKPDGETYGYRNVWYTYSTSTIDPNGDDVRYQFEFTGPSTNVSFTTGWYASGQTGSLTVMWDTTDPLGTYQIRVRAQDVYEEWSCWSPYLTVNIVNRAPNTPSLTGPNYGYVGGSYTYKACATDPDGDSVKYTFYWGDGSTTTTGYYGSGVEVSRSHSWSSTGSYSVKVKATDVYGAYKYSSSLTVTIYSGGGGCPMLFVWNGAEYVEEGLLDIHNPEGVDVIYEHTLVSTPQRENGAYLLRLTEHPQTHSYIDEVKLYAILEDGTTIELPLIYAWHSEGGNVLPQLLHSDDWKADTLGADHNNGTSQSIDLKFASLSPNLEIIGFVFEIEGNNRISKL